MGPGEANSLEIPIAQTNKQTNIKRLFPLVKEPGEGQSNKTETF